MKIRQYEVEDMLTTYFEELCKKYKIDNVEFICFSTWIEFIEIQYKDRYRRYCKTSEDLLNEIQGNAGLYCDTAMFSVYDNPHKNDPDKIEHKIIFTEEAFYKMMFMINNANFEITKEEFFEYLRLCLLHEIGHVVSLNTLFKRYGVIEGTEMLSEKEEQEFPEFMAYVHESLDNLELLDAYVSEKGRMIKYYEMTSERMANETVNVDVDRFIDLDLKIRQSIIPSTGRDTK